MQFPSNVESNVFCRFENSDTLTTVSNEDCCGQSAKLLSTLSENATELVVGAPVYVSNDVIDVSNDLSDVSYTCDVSKLTNHDDPLMACLVSQRLTCPDELVVAHVNVNSIRHKFAYFHHILLKGLIDILCISETKLDETFMNNLFYCHGYRCHRKDKSAQSGGIMVWVRADIPHVRVNDLELDVSSNIESVVLHFQFKKVKFYLSCVYKHPSISNGVFIESLCSLYDKIGNCGSESVLLGDVNIDMLTNKVLENDLCDIYGLANVIVSPTCYKSKNGTLIDPIIVSNTAKFFKPFNAVCGYSDWHNMVGCLVKVKYPKPKQFTVTYRNAKHFNEEDFKREVEMLPSHICEVFDSVDDKYWAFSSLYTDLLNTHAPLKTRMVRSKKIPYMHSDLMKAIYKRNQLKNLYFKNRTSNEWELYRQQRNKVTKMRKEAIKNYFMRCCSNKTSPKEFWQCFKPFFTDKKSNTTTNIVLKESDKIVSDTNKVCEILNNFFVTIADEIGNPVTVNDSDFSGICDNYSNHGSVLKIKKFHVNPDVFTFQPAMLKMFISYSSH